MKATIFHKDRFARQVSLRSVLNSYRSESLQSLEVEKREFERL